MPSARSYSGKSWCRHQCFFRSHCHYDSKKKLCSTIAAEYLFFFYSLKITDRLPKSVASDIRIIHDPVCTFLYALSYRFGNSQRVTVYRIICNRWIPVNVSTVNCLFWFCQRSFTCADKPLSLLFCYNHLTHFAENSQPESYT